MCPQNTGTAKIGKMLYSKIKTHGNPCQFFANFEFQKIPGFDFGSQNGEHDSLNLIPGDPYD